MAHFYSLSSDPFANPSAGGRWGKMTWSLASLYYFLIRPAITKHPFPAGLEKPEDHDDQKSQKKWWEQPTDITSKELSLLKWFSSITDKLPTSRRAEVWSMRGGKPLGPDQLGFTSIRSPPFASFTVFSLFLCVSGTTWHFLPMRSQRPFSAHLLTWAEQNECWHPSRR